MEFLRIYDIEGKLVNLIQICKIIHMTKDMKTDDVTIALENRDKIIVNMDDALFKTVDQILP